MQLLKNKKVLMAGVVTPAVIFFDQVTKQLILSKFQYGEISSVIKNIFDLTYVRNTGAAFGIFATAHPAFRIPFFVVVPLVALIIIAYIFKKIGEHQWGLMLALSLVIGGAVGNLIDRLRFGYVVDFLLFHWKYVYQFPAFNVADMAISIGIGILLLDLVLQPDPDKKDTNASDTI